MKENYKEEKTLKFAVATKGGMTVDLHFGHATEFYIYEYRNDIAMFLEKRSVNKYCNGKEECDEEDKITRLGKAIKDCDGVISLRIGTEPTRKLNELNIESFMSCDRVEEAVVAAAKTLINKESKVKILKA